MGLVEYRPGPTGGSSGLLRVLFELCFTSLGFGGRVIDGGVFDRDRALPCPALPCPALPCSAR